jgi:hypothetical protein
VDRQIAPEGFVATQEVRAKWVAKPITIAKIGSHPIASGGGYPLAAFGLFAFLSLISAERGLS